MSKYNENDDFETLSRRFASLAEIEAGRRQEYESEWIGIYNEKRLHRILKATFCTNSDCFEVGVGERYVADVLDENGILEVQCASLKPLEKKLRFYLDNTEHNICVVHPLTVKKTLVRIDKESGEIIRKSVSPKRENEYTGLAHLYPIRELLANERVRVRFVFIESEEHRYSERMYNRKKGAFDNELFPIALRSCVEYREPIDYADFIPEELYGKTFTAKDFIKYSKLKSRDNYSALNTLSALGLLKREQEGRNVIYKA